MTYLASALLLLLAYVSAFGLFPPDFPRVDLMLVLAAQFLLILARVGWGKVEDQYVRQMRAMASK